MFNIHYMFMENNKHCFVADLLYPHYHIGME